MREVKVAIVGVGNCASSLVQGINYYAKAFAAGEEIIGLTYPELGGIRPGDVKIVAAFDVDARKVGAKLHDALMAKPNNTKVFFSDFKYDNVVVQMGNPLDGISEHMAGYDEDERFVLANKPAATKEQVVKTLKESGAEVLVNYMPVGSQKATEFYAECCLESGVSLVNCMPVFIVSNKAWSERFKKAGIPCVGDDIKAQVGATITHRVLTKLIADRGGKIDATYQLNTGGNTDFLNMLNRDRLDSKKISKTQAVQSQLEVPLPANQVHIGPADYVPWQKDNKICFCRIEGRGFGGVPFNLEMRLSVEDSPNSAGEVIDAIRCCKLARDAGIAGPLEAVAAYTMKHPPVQYPDSVAREMLENFITDTAKAQPQSAVKSKVKLQETH